MFAICVVTLYSYLAGSMDFYNLFICIYIYVYILFYFHLVGSANDCTVYGDMISNYNSSSWCLQWLLWLYINMLLVEFVVHCVCQCFLRWFSWCFTMCMCVFKLLSVCLGDSYNAYADIILIYIGVNWLLLQYLWWCILIIKWFSLWLQCSWMLLTYRWLVQLCFLQCLCTCLTRV